MSDKPNEKASELVERALDAALIDQAEIVDREVVVAVVAALEQRVDGAVKLLDDAGIEHSGRTLDERVRELIEERDTARRIAIRIKKAYAAEEEA